MGEGGRTRDARDEPVVDSRHRATRDRIGHRDDAGDEHDELLDELRALANTVDPVPDEVTRPVRASPATIEAERDDGSVAAKVDADELGRFRLELSDQGRIRLRVRREPKPDVETSRVSV